MSSTDTFKTRRSPRKKSINTYEDEDGVVRTDTTNELNIAQNEDGQRLSKAEKDALAEHIANGGSTELVTDSHWKDVCSPEHASFYDELLSFADGLRGSKKNRFDSIVSKYEHAMQLQTVSSSTDGANSDKSAFFAGSDKHERMVQVAGAQAYQAATTQNKSALLADAAMAKAMGAREDKRAEELSVQMEELKKQYEESLKNRDEQHKNELLSVVKDAREQAAKEADELNTRSREKKKQDTETAATELEKSIESSASSSSPNRLQIPAAAMNGALADVLRSQGFDIETATEDTDKRPNKSKKNSKAKANPDQDDNGGKKQSSKKRKHEVRQEDIEALASADEDDVEEKPKRAKDYYTELGISGPSKLGTIVDRINELEEMRNDYDVVKGHLRELIDKYTTVRAQRKAAVALLRNEFKVTDEVLLSKNILASSK